MSIDEPLSCLFPRHDPIEYVWQPIVYHRFDLFLLIHRHVFEEDRDVFVLKIHNIEPRFIVSFRMTVIVNSIIVVEHIRTEC
jgi:hypothetical protein